MEMNLHPMFVHFPVALFTLYAVSELLRFKKLLRSQTWFLIKATMLWIGFLGSLGAYFTGQAQEIVAGNPLIELHGQWALATAWLFGTLAVIYALIALEHYYNAQICRLIGPRGEQIFVRLTKLARAIHGSLLTPLLALIGLVSITITGALGGSIVYGPDVDPVAQLVHRFFFPSGINK